VGAVSNDFVKFLTVGCWSVSDSHDCLKSP